MSYRNGRPGIARATFVKALFSRRARRSLLAVVGTVGAMFGSLGLTTLGLALAGAPAAYAAPCSDSWKTAVSGSWSTPGDWSTGVVPSTGDNVCITVAGTYTVTLTGQPSGINTLALGGTSGTQTLSLVPNPTNGYAELTAAASSSISADGVLDIATPTSGGYYAKYTQTAGTLTNTGTITVDAPSVAGVSDYLDGAIDNQGSVDANSTLTLASGSFTDDTGSTFAIANGVLVTAS